MAKYGICTNIINCENADEKKILAIPDGQDFFCPNPDCGKELRLAQPAGGGGTGLPKPVLLLGGLLLIAGLGWGGWKLFASDTTPVVEISSNDTSQISGPNLPVPPSDTTTKQPIPPPSQPVSEDPTDYRPFFELTKASIFGKKGHHASFSNLIEAAEIAIKNGESKQLLLDLGKDHAAFKKLTDHHEWEMIMEALTANDASKLKHHDE